MNEFIRNFFAGRRDASVLVADDHEMSRKSVQKHLHNFGFPVVHTATDGEEAFNIFARKEKEIVLVVSDLEMPKMNGDDLFRQIRMSGSRAPIILMSGNFNDIDFDRLHGEGLAGFVQKPFTRQQFLTAVTLALIPAS